ncbi:peroxidase, partial [Rhodococcus jostii]
MAERPTGPGRGVSRRRLLAGGAAAALGAAGLGWGTHDMTDHLTGAVSDGGLTEPFYGPHQGGIATEPQAHAQFVGLNLRPGADRSTAAGVLKVWTQDA